MIILQPRSTAYEAARAMADSNVGAVLVAENQRIVGIVTDRDLALDVVAGDLDPRATSLRDVMSDEVVTCEVSGTILDVVQAMLDHGCRRVPLTQQGQPVGIVTFDDLMLDGGVDLAVLRAIVEKQLEVATRFKADGEIYPGESTRPALGMRRARTLQRHRSRAETTYHRTMAAVERQTGLERRLAERATLVVLAMICRRLTPDEARHFMAQLPSKLHPELFHCLDGPDKRIDISSIEEALSRELAMDRPTAGDVLYRVCEAIADFVSMGEIEGIRSQLPADMKDLFPMPPFRRTA
jgi:CBS domain-containing protein/uncharacterized protein (DUF2267 family)